MLEGRVEIGRAAEGFLDTPVQFLKFQIKPELFQKEWKDATCVVAPANLVLRLAHVDQEIPGVRWHPSLRLALGNQGHPAARPAREDLQRDQWHPFPQEDQECWKTAPVFRLSLSLPVPPVLQAHPPDPLVLWDLALLLDQKVPDGQEILEFPLFHLPRVPHRVDL